jgi:hypothetical protein
VLKRSWESAYCIPGSHTSFVIVGNGFEGVCLGELRVKFHKKSIQLRTGVVGFGESSKLQAAVGTCQTSLSVLFWCISVSCFCCIIHQDILSSVTYNFYYEDILKGV